MKIDNINKILFTVFGLLLVYNVICQDSIIKDGYNIIYHKNGKVSSEGYMRNGKPDGYWKTYFQTGILKSEGNRKNFLLDSTWIFYSMFGDTLEKINYIIGKRNGYSYVYYADRNNKTEFIGNIISKEMYINDKKEGISFYYNNDGSLNKIMNFSNNKADGFAYEFENEIIVTILRYNKGNIIERERINRYNNENLKVGLWKDFYENYNVKKEVNYYNGLKSGTYKEYKEDGDLILRLKYDNDKIIEEIEVQDSVEIVNETDAEGNVIFSGSFKNGIPIGIHRFFDIHGKVKNAYLYNDSGVKIAEGRINPDGSKEGKWKYFYSSGIIKSEGVYENNREQGKWKFFYKNKSIEQTGDFRNGLLNGIWTWYFDDGKVRKEEGYFNGEEEGESIEYDRNGNIVSKGEYIEGEKEGFWKITVNDHIEEGNYVTGLRDGKWKYYYNDGTLKFEGGYVQGNADGKHRYYYENGVLKEEQYFAQGLKEKHWKKYDKEGNLLITISYDSDNEIRINGEKIELDRRNVKIIR
ncbi:MAG: hypothetical protein R6W78_15565 [Bacteroidales bacterium]